MMMLTNLVNLVDLIVRNHVMKFFDIIYYYIFIYIIYRGWAKMHLLHLFLVPFVGQVAINGQDFIRGTPPV